MLDQSAGCVPARAMPHITQAPNGERTTQVSVLIYNVEGLPWPARKNRKPSLQQIGDTLRTMRQNGSAPDIVMVQEAFTPAARDVLAQASYGDVIAGFIGGDFNMRGDAARFAAFVETQPCSGGHEFCVAQPGTCLAG